jgi:hypothetical protein
MATHVFYSPHSDDEAIGMAGSIIRAKAEGHRVELILVTDNLASARAHQRFPLSGEELAEARLREFRKSADCLGVDRIEYWRIPEALIAHDRSFALATFLGAMTAKEHDSIDGGDDCVHHTVMGAGDIHRELGRSTQAHRLCEDAAVIFAQRNPLTDVFLHAVYLYSFPLEERAFRAAAFSVLELTPRELERKRRALQAYQKAGDCIGYGYDSVPDLIDAAATDPREYFWKL